jgi:hypothetical protein
MSKLNFAILVSRIRLPRLVLSMAALVVGGVERSARADLEYGTSSGYGVSANLTVLSTVEATAATGLASGAGTAYNVTGSAAAAAINLPLVASLSVGAVQSSASSTVTSGVQTTQGTGNIVTPTSGSLLAGLVSLSAGVIDTSASVYGTPGNYTITPTVNITNLSIGTGILSFSASGNIAANTTVGGALGTALGLLGITIVLNEETPLGPVGHPDGVSVNAIDIHFLNSPVTGGLANGDIIIGHADAMMGPVVPVPPSLILMGSGLFGVLGTGFVRVRSSMTKAKAPAAI